MNRPLYDNMYDWRSPFHERMIELAEDAEWDVDWLFAYITGAIRWTYRDFP